MNLSTAVSSGLLAVGTTVVKNSKTYLKSVTVVGNATDLAQVVVYDNASTASGKVLAKQQTVADAVSIVFTYPVKAEAGLVVVVTGTGAEAIVTFDA